MKLVYEGTDTPVEVGDEILIDGEVWEVDYITKPHKPSSTGRVGVKREGTETAEYFPSVIDAVWVDREDQYKEYFQFLDRLRERGTTNMFGASTVLVDVYDITKQEARKIVALWMEQFERSAVK